MDTDLIRKKEVVLIVDDDPVLKDLTKDILELFGHTALVSGTRGDAVRLCERWGKDISVMLLDISHAKSAEATVVFEKITEINPRVKIIVTSTNNADNGMTHLFGRTAGFLKKPYRMTELMKMVEDFQNS